MSSSFKTLSSPTTDTGADRIYGENWNYTIQFLKLTTPNQIVLSKSGTTYYANRNDGGLVSSSSDFDTVLSNAITDISDDGGRLFIKKINGVTYDIDSSVSLPSTAVDFIIESDFAEVKRTSNLTMMFNKNGNTGKTVFRNIYFNGNSAGSGNTNKAIGGSSGSYLRVDGCVFDGYGTRHPVGVSGMTHVSIANNWIGDCGGLGSEGGCNDVQYTGNYVFEAVNDYPFMVAGNLTSNTRIMIDRNILSTGNTAGGGIDVVGSYVTITNNIINTPYLHGIYVHDNDATGGTDYISNVLISNNIIKGVGAGGGKSVVVENIDDSTDAFVCVSDNYLDKGLGLTSIRNAEISSNIFATGQCYTIGGVKLNFHDNVFAGSIAFNIESTATYMDDVMIANNRIDSATPFNGSRLPTTATIKNNKGYNPQGAASISVTGSPFTYTAGATPEAVYIRGGTVSSIAKNSVTLFTATPATVFLEPNESVVVTYTGAPTMVKDRK